MKLLIIRLGENKKIIFSDPEYSKSNLDRERENKIDQFRDFH